MLFSPTTFAIGAILKIFVLLAPLAASVLLSWRYDSVSEKKKGRILFFGFSIFLVLHLIFLDAVMFREIDSPMPAEFKSPIELIFSYLFLLAAVAALYFWSSTLENRLFGQPLFNRHFLVLILASGAGALVFASQFGSLPIETVSSSALYTVSWILVPAIYVSLYNIYSKFKTKFSKLVLLGALVSVSNPVIFTFAVKSCFQAGALSFDTFYSLRGVAMAVSVVGAALASVPAFSFLKDLLMQIEDLRIQQKSVFSRFVHEFVFRYSRIIGKVSWTIYESALADFGKAPDWELDSLPEAKKRDFLGAAFSKYLSLTGLISKRICWDAFSSSAEFRKNRPVNAAVLAFTERKYQ
ncbi:MAG: hypothetical protein V1820_05620 [archaeon]